MTAGKLSKAYTAHTCKKTAIQQLLYHSIDAVWGFPDVFQQQNRPLRVRLKGRSRQGRKHGEVPTAQSTFRDSRYPRFPLQSGGFSGSHPME